MANIGSTLEKPTVLIVDDSPDDITLIGELLTDLYKIKIANNGERALKVARTGTPPDLILLDVMMPVMDGYETCRRLKEIPETLNIPVIFLTSKTELEDEMKGFELGAVDYINKPISPPIVLARVQTHLQLKQVRDYLKDKTAFLEDEVGRRIDEILAARRLMTTQAEALRVKELVFDASIAANSIADINGVITEANDAFLRLWNYSGKGEVIGKPIDHFFNEASEASAMVTVLDETGRWEEDFEAKKRDGTTFIAHGQATVVQDEKGQTIGYQSAVVDVTEQRRSEESIIKAKQEWEQTFDTVPDLIMLLGKDHRILRANRAMAEPFGKTCQQLIGRHCYEVVHGLSAPPQTCPHARLLCSGKEERSEFREEGLGLFLDVRTTPLYHEDGQLRGSVHVVRDITKQKEAEHQIRERIKEMQAFFTLSNLRTREGITTEELCQELANVLPQSWQYPEITCARIVIGEKEFRTNNFKESEWMQSAPIEVRNSVVGKIEVGYLEERSASDEGPFMKEERQLINSLSERLGHFIAQKEAEENLASLVRQHDLILSSVAEGILGLDLQGNHTFVNPAAAMMLGYESKELIGRNSHSTWHHTKIDGSPYPKEECNVYTTLRDGTINRVSTEVFWKKDGTSFPVEYSSTPVLERGQVTSSVLTFIDITERKRIENHLHDTLESLRKSMSATIQVMVSTVEARDPYTAGHQLRSADLAHAIATEMGLPQNKIEGLRIAASIHDIGKISIPAEILSKPTKLSEIEFSLIKAHSQRGYEMLKDVESPWPLAEIVYQHHERMDGSGYPRNLKGKDICIEARILTVADTMEAMAFHRPYRPGLGIDAALAEIEKNSGVCYDTAVADACLRLFREKGFKLAEA